MSRYVSQRNPFLISRNITIVQFEEARGFHVIFGEIEIIGSEMVDGAQFLVSMDYNIQCLLGLFYWEFLLE